MSVAGNSAEARQLGPRTGGPAGAQGAPPADATAGAAALLRLESELHRVRTRAEFDYFMANEPRTLLRAQQIAVVAPRTARGNTRIAAISSVAAVDGASPFVMWLDEVVARLEQDAGLGGAREFDPAAFPTTYQTVSDAFPLRHMLWMPLLDPGGAAAGGLLLARTVPWTEQEIVIARHVAATLTRAAAWLERDAGRVRGRLSGVLVRWRTLLAAAVVAGVAMFPVSMTALAPAEVAPRNPTIVTAGVEGVVETVLVKPSANVRAGEVLLRMVDTTLKNRFEVAEREVLVASARRKKAGQLAFVDVRGRHELAIAEAELELKVAERNWARELLSRAEVRAERAGVALFADPKDLTGRPFAIGEKLMDIADPAELDLRIDLPVGDAIVLAEGARVKVFLDSDPLNPIETRLVRVDHQARLRDGQALAFRLVADGSAAESRGIRLGIRGTAQIYGDMVPLGFYLLRRPIGAARQWAGL